MPLQPPQKIRAVGSRDFTVMRLAVRFNETLEGKPQPRRDSKPHTANFFSRNNVGAAAEQPRPHPEDDSDLSYAILEVGRLNLLARFLRRPKLVEKTALLKAIQIAALDEILRFDFFCPRIDFSSLIDDGLKGFVLEFQPGLQKLDFLIIGGIEQFFVRDP